MRARTRGIRIGVIAAVLSAPLHGAAMAGGAAADAAKCPRDGTLGVSRTVQIDTTGGPGFGLEHYKAYDFLQPKEVVLTFDDGPQKFSTEMVLAALAEQCAKATFFSIGKMALGYPEIIREVVHQGHTVGTHTWSHQNLRKSKTPKDAEDEIERGISAVHRAVGGPIAPFFRFPTLQDSPDALAHLNKRNVSMFSTDIDSFDFKLQPPATLVKSVMAKLDKAGKGILLMHDIHKNTAKAVPLLLTALKENGYKIVHITAKDAVTTLPEYDAAIEKDAKGLPVAGSERPISGVVKTIEGTPTADEQSNAAPPATPAETTAELPAAVAPVATTETASPAAVPTIPSAPPATADAVAAPDATTTSSISPVRDIDPNAQPAPPASAPAAAPSKSIGQRAGELWDLWFGKP